MTQRNRRSRSRGRRRSGRMVWVNHDLNLVLAPNTIQLQNLLVNAPDFMLFDSTIQTVIIEDLSFTFDSLAPAGLRRIAIGLIVAQELIDPDDLAAPLVDGTGPGWLGMLTTALNLSGVAPQNMSLTPHGPQRFNAKRRFRENDVTLHMQMQNVTPASDTNLKLSGIIRTLLHIP